ncbi:hypothetical protein [Sphingobium sp. Ant17]|jgi:hypothetical protein|uniref:hypothetical protein n=1 Tax=Sphingobium sp. Ant17 TaxID=1461752 RepID=UPI00045122D5|nr:hypothetical protein [Sphingobium sp. Ant17]EXS70254.1 hypothetical protein BF95_25295 [Sphingobium sp. Ant17]MDE0946404.1 hypothetical protein [Sphingobium sp.]OHC47717.1 MAG: hypothetical protein A2X69_17505 [Rhodobacteraceae bacterium GWF1_65_7]|tara:strand:+ start:17836 stop:18180 length:345 start_codon:yes stop_codon:yes gene_type:complete
MKKPRTPSAPLVTVRPPKRAGILRKVARVGATVVATRVAAATGKAGILGLVAGMGAKRVIMRHPAGALFVTGAYMAGKLYEAKREVDRKRAAKLLPDMSGEPIPIDSARKTREG